jgi:methyl-accepting chemotaxis protein
MTIRSLFLLAVSGLLIAITVIASVFVAVETKSTITADVLEQRNALRDEVNSILSVTDSLMAKRVKSSLDLLVERGDEIGTPRIDGFSDVGGTRAPALYLGDSMMNNEFGLVDGLTEVMEGTATLFVNDGKDFIRVATNVKKSDGSRAIGTKLNLNSGAGRAIQSGKTFFGQVEILGNPYLTAYSPMRNAQQETVGIWYVGYSADLEVLDEAIKSSRLLDEGFVGVVDDKGGLRMLSGNSDHDRVKALLTDTPEDWQIQRTDFEPWGYQIVTGYSESEVSAMVWSQMVRTILLIVFGGLVLIVCLAVLVQLVIAKPLTHMIDTINDIAEGEGDLTVRFNSSKRNELGVMAQGFDKLLNRLQATIAETKQSSESWFEASGKLGQIASASESAVAEQAGQTEQVSTAMSEMRETAQTVAESAATAEDLATEADGLASKGQAMLGKTIDAIAEQLTNNEQSVKASSALQEASDNIGNILSVIENIAGQTNLLALNAAIEAARAGEHGRGFAVVSDEVRNLASRTQDSIKEIHDQISHLQEGVKMVGDVIGDGNRLASAAQETIKAADAAIASLSDSVRAIRETNTNIASAAEEQSQVSEDINDRLDQIRRIAGTSHDNAAATNEAAASLTAMAERLRAQLAHYRT